MQTLVPSFRRITLNPREPALAISLHFDLAREARETRCKLLGVANVASVLLGELSEPFGAMPKGTLAALFETSEGQILHVATGAPYVEPPPPSTPVTPPAPAIVPPYVASTYLMTPEESIAAAVNSHDDVAAERDLWKEEAQGLSEQLTAMKAQRDRAIEERDARATALNDAEQATALVSMQLTATKAKLVVAVEDRNALAERLKVEREQLTEAMGKLDRLDKRTLTPAPAPLASVTDDEELDATSTENDTDEG